MDLGVVLPTSEVGNDPSALRDFAQAAESLGFRRLSTYEHVLGAEHARRAPELRGPYTEHTPFHEPMVLFGFLAAHTSRLELGTSVLVAPQRQTALIAKQAAEVSLLSAGRLVLGLGTGWNRIEYAGMGADFGTRGVRLDEQVIVLRLLWSEAVVEFDGRWHRLERVGISPRPEHPIPILFGGSADAALDRAARLGDGFVLRSSGGERRREIERLHKLLDDRGRDPSHFQLDAFVDYADGPERWLEELDRFAALGGTLLSLRTFAGDLDWQRPAPDGRHPVGWHIAALERFAEVVGARAGG